MQHFIDHGFVDENLPTSMEFCSQHPAFSLKSWKPALKRNFCKGQWDHLVPVFSLMNFIFQLEQNQPLPFLAPKERGNQAPEGSSSIVHKVTIHEDHLDNPPLDVSPYTYTALAIC